MNKSTNEKINESVFFPPIFFGHDFQKDGTLAVLAKEISPTGRVGLLDVSGGFFSGWDYPTIVPFASGLFPRHKPCTNFLAHPSIVV